MNFKFIIETASTAPVRLRSGSGPVNVRLSRTNRDELVAVAASLGEWRTCAGAA